MIGCNGNGGEVEIWSYVRAELGTVFYLDGDEGVSRVRDCCGLYGNI